MVGIVLCCGEREWRNTIFGEGGGWRVNICGDDITTCEDLSGLCAEGKRRACFGGDGNSICEDIGAPRAEVTTGFITWDPITGVLSGDLPLRLKLRHLPGGGNGDLLPRPTGMEADPAPPIGRETDPPPVIGKEVDPVLLSPPSPVENPVLPSPPCPIQKDVDPVLLSPASPVLPSP